MMKILEQIEKTREYLDYLETHVLNVRKAFGEFTEKCKDLRVIYDDCYYNWLGKEIENHDLSKMSSEEFTSYRKEFFPAKGDEEKFSLFGLEFDSAWEHHKNNNPHHWENWTQKSMNQPHEWEVHCSHMIIDWMAMGYKFGDTAEQYYESNKDKIELPEYTIDFIYEIFDRLK